MKERLGYRNTKCILYNMKISKKYLNCQQVRLKQLTIYVLVDNFTYYKALANFLSLGYRKALDDEITGYESF